MWTEISKTAGKGLKAVHALGLSFIQSDRDAKHLLHAVATELEDSIQNSKDLVTEDIMGEIEYGSRPAYVDNSGVPAFYEAEGELDVPVGASYKYTVTVPLKSIAENLKLTIKSAKRMPTQEIIQALYIAFNTNSPRLNESLSSHFVAVHALGGGQPEYTILPTEPSEVVDSPDADYSSATFEEFDFSIKSMVSKGYGLDFSIEGDFHFDTETIEAVEITDDFLL